jgi:hypothetical protein
VIFPIKITKVEKLFHKLKSGISKRNNSKKHPIRKPKKNIISGDWVFSKEYLTNKDEEKE